MLSRMKLLINCHCCIYLVVCIIVSEMHDHTNIKLPVSFHSRTRKSSKHVRHSNKSITIFRINSGLSSVHILHNYVVYVKFIFHNFVSFFLHILSQAKSLLIKINYPYVAVPCTGRPHTGLMIPDAV